jgi:hypothetical protein
LDQTFETRLISTNKGINNSAGKQKEKAAKTRREPVKNQSLQEETKITESHEECKSKESALREQIKEVMSKSESQKILTFMIVHDLKHPTEALISMVKTIKTHLSGAKSQFEDAKLIRSQLR